VDKHQGEALEGRKDGEMQGMKTEKRAGKGSR
jgi:hypothetical protein